MFDEIGGVGDSEVSNSKRSALVSAGCLGADPDLDHFMVSCLFLYSQNIYIQTQTQTLIKQNLSSPAPFLIGQLTFYFLNEGNLLRNVGEVQIGSVKAI